MKNVQPIPKLLTRESFRAATLKRDQNKCVFCADSKCLAVHHIIERHLFANGGYYLDNGASVCEAHNWACEKTDISVEELRHACGIKNVILPPNFDPLLSYDKWGNIRQLNGMMLPGPLFFQDNVQKILKDKLHLFDI